MAGFMSTLQPACNTDLPVLALVERKGFTSTAAWINAVAMWASRQEYAENAAPKVVVARLGSVVMDYASEHGMALRVWRAVIKMRGALEGQASSKAWPAVVWRGRWQIAQAVGFDGAHVPRIHRQAYDHAARPMGLRPGFWLSTPVSDVAELMEGQAFGANRFLAGPVLDPGCKPAKRGLGFLVLRKICRAAPGQVWALGGMGNLRAKRKAAALGAAGVAMLSRYSRTTANLSTNIEDF